MQSEKTDTKENGLPSAVKHTPPGRKPVTVRQINKDCHGEMFRVEYCCEFCNVKEVWHAYSYNPRHHCAKCGMQMSVTRRPI